MVVTLGHGLLQGFTVKGELELGWVALLEFQVDKWINHKCAELSDPIRLPLLPNMAQVYVEGR